MGQEGAAFQVLDIQEHVSERGLDLIRLIGKDRGGRVQVVDVPGAPATISIAGKFTPPELAQIEAGLEGHLGRSWLPCRSWGCACGSKSWAIYREPCARRRATPARAVLQARQVESRGFEPIDEATTHFAQFTLSNAHHAGQADKFLSKTWKVYDRPGSGVDQFLVDTGASSFSWVTAGAEGVRLVPGQPETNWTILYVGANYAADMVVEIQALVSPGAGPRGDGRVFKWGGSESALLCEFLDWFRALDPDVIFEFDHVMRDLTGRCEAVGVQGPALSRIADQPFAVLQTARGLLVDCPGRLIINLRDRVRATVDLLPLYDRWHVLNHFDLDLDMNMAWAAYWIGTRLDVMGTIQAESQLFGVRASETRGNTYKLEMLIRRHVRGHMLIPSRRAPEGGRYQGGLVLEPEVGLCQDPVHTFDVNSMYPSLMIDRNICLSTLVRGGEGASFCPASTRRGVLPEIQGILVEKRKAIQELIKEGAGEQETQTLRTKQAVVKLTANALYGSLGDPRSIIYSTEVAAAVTAAGRDTLQRVVARLGAWTGRPIRVIYGDTDSVKIRLPGCAHSDAVAVGRELDAWINAGLGGALRMKQERLALRTLVYGKKRLAQVLSPGDELALTGLPTRNQNMYTASVMRRVLKMQLVDGAGPEAVAAAVDEAIRGLTGQDPQTLLHTLPVNKPPAEYPAGSLITQVCAQLAAVGFLPPNTGERVGYYHTRTGIVAHPLLRDPADLDFDIYEREIRAGVASLAVPGLVRESAKQETSKPVQPRANQPTKRPRAAILEWPGHTHA